MAKMRSPESSSKPTHPPLLGKMPAYAHSAAPGLPWEPLHTPFGNAPGDCRRHACEACQQLSPDHGHLNKVAYWTATFAACKNRDLES